MFGQLAKWVAEIDDAEPHSGVSSPAPSPWRRRAGRGRWCCRCRRTCSPTPSRPWARSRPHRPCEIFPSGAQMAAARRDAARLRAPAPPARRQPLGRRHLRRGAALRRGERSRRCRDLPPAGPASTTGIRCYVGDVGIGINPKLAARVGEADLLIVARRAPRRDDDGRLRALRRSRPEAEMVHIHPGAEELGRVYQPALAINATPRGFAAMLARSTVEAPPWRGVAEAAGELTRTT